MNISFAWTTEALLAGRKTCTRRVWSERTTRAWQRAWDEGHLTHIAWDKLACWGGKRLGTIRLTCRPYRQRLRDMPEEDLIAEGGLWETREEFWNLFPLGADQAPTVVRFTFVSGEIQERTNE